LLIWIGRFVGAVSANEKSTFTKGKYMEKKAARNRNKNPKLRLNKDSLRPVSKAALRNVVGGTGGTPCPTPSSEEPVSTCHTTCSCTY
jgi:hypothetical protein